MNRKKIASIVLAMGLLVGCTNKPVVQEKSFKEDYEQYNGLTNESGKEHRTITIDTTTEFIYTDLDTVIDMAENEQSFYMYFGDALCPWCRSVIEVASQVSQEKQIDKIYYVDIWDDDHNEIVRDVYVAKDGLIEKESDGIESYQKLLELADAYLSEYSIEDEYGNKFSLGEKRVFAPTFFYFEKGEVVRTTDGISSLQEDAREPLSSEMLEEERQLFNTFFQ